MLILILGSRWLRERLVGLSPDRALLQAWVAVGRVPQGNQVLAEALEALRDYMTLLIRSRTSSFSWLSSAVDSLEKWATSKDRTLSVTP
jgi:hypothetical protein